MSLPDKPSVDELFARHVVKNYGTIRVVNVPGVTLSERERAAFFAKLEEQPQPTATVLDADALISKLSELTPPPNHDEDEERLRSLEHRAREYLEGVGCPPCYPAELEFPLRSPPERYSAIISYYKSLPGTGELVLRAQETDWKSFRQFQEKNRGYYVRRKIKPFSDFEDAVRQRRRKHNLEGDVQLRPEAGQQSRIQNWVEFQDYHLRCHESLQKEIEGLKTGLNKAPEESGRAVATTSRPAAGGAESCKSILESTEQRLERHRALLCWIEQKRVGMAARHTTSAKGGSGEGDGMQKAAREASRRRPRRQTTRSVLAPAPSRVSKLEPQKRKMQRPKKPKVQEVKPATADLGAPPKSTSRASSSREKRPRRTREQKALGPLQPGKVSKTNRSASAKANRSLAARTRGGAQGRPPDGARSSHRQLPERQRPATSVVLTRYGRESRKPERWVPGS